MQYNKPYAEMSPETMRLFMDCDWPGNVRELEELVKRAVALGTEAPIRKEIAQTIALFQQTHWNRKETAAILGITCKALLYKIKENGLDKVS